MALLQIRLFSLPTRASFLTHKDVGLQILAELGRQYRNKVSKRLMQ